MTYKTERDLQLELSSIDFEFFDSHPVSFVKREVRVGGCIPDLVSIHFMHDPSFEPWPSKWSYKQSYIIWLLRKWQSLPAEQIALLCFEQRERIFPFIQELIDNSIVLEDNKGQLFLSKHVAEINTKVVAIEAKLRKWKDALNQAIRYKDFADIVLVAMDSTQVPESDNVYSEFKEHQIGLCAVSSGYIKWLVYPEASESDPGHEKEYLVMSAIIPSTQILWSRRNRLTASSHA